MFNIGDVVSVRTKQGGRRRGTVVRVIDYTVAGYGIVYQVKLFNGGFSVNANADDVSAPTPHDR